MNTIGRLIDAIECLEVERTRVSYSAEELAGQLLHLQHRSQPDNQALVAKAMAYSHVLLARAQMITESQGARGQVIQPTVMAQTPPGPISTAYHIQSA